MTDDDGGSAFGDFLQVLHHNGLAFRVQRAGGFVEDDDAGLAQQGAGDGNALLLAAGKVDGTLLQPGVVALRQLLDELVRPGHARGPHDILEGRGRHAHADIVLDRATKQEGLLRHHAVLGAQMSEVDILDVVAIDADGAFGGGVQALQQGREGGLARAAAADNADHGAGGNLQTDIAQGRTFGAGIAEGHLLELDGTRKHRCQAALAAVLGGAVHDFAQHLHAHQHFLIVVEQADHLQDRADDAARQHVEGDQAADGEGAVEHQEGAGDDDGDGQRLLHEIGKGVGDQADLAHLDIGVDRVGGSIVPGFLAARFQVQRLDRAHAMHAFHQQRLALGLGGIEMAQTAAIRPQHGGDGQSQDGRHAQHHQGELDAVPQQQRQEDQQRRQVEQRAKQAAGEEFADLRSLLHMLGDDAGTRLVEEADRQPHQVAEGELGQANVDAAGHPQDEITTQPVEDRVEQDGGGDAAADHHQGGDAEVDQDTIDDDLEEDRHGQRQNMHGQRRADDIGQQGALAPEFRPEPVQAETGRLGARLAAALEQNDFAVPVGEELVLRHGEEVGFRHQRIEQRDLFGLAFLPGRIAHLHGHKPGAGVQTHQEGRKLLRARQFFPAGLVPPRLHPF